MYPYSAFGFPPAFRVVLLVVSGTKVSAIRPGQPLEPRSKQSKCPWKMPEIGTGSKIVLGTLMQAILARGAEENAVAVKTSAALQSLTDAKATTAADVYYYAVVLFALIGLIQTLCWSFKAMRYLFCSQRADMNAEMSGLEIHEIPIHLRLDCGSLQARRDLPVLKTKWGGQIHSLRICGACLRRELASPTSSRHQMPADEKGRIYVSTTSLNKLKTR